MKVVWLLNHYAASPNDAGGTRHFNLAKYALKLGYRIVIVAASVEHFTGRQRLNPGEAQRLEEIDGVRFLWLRTSEYHGNGLDRIFNMLQYTWRVLGRRTTRILPPPDLIIGSSVHPLAAWAGSRLAARHAVPFIFEIRDLWPETLIDMGSVRRGGPTARLLGWLERYLCERASRIIVLLPRAVEYLTDIGIRAEKVVWIPNGIDLEAVPYQEPAPSDSFTLMYLGAHGQANGLEDILTALAGCPAGVRDRVRVRFVGDGPLKPQLQSRAVELGLDGVVSFEPPVAKAGIPELAAEADAFVLVVRDLPLYRFGFSFNKLFDYLAAGRPVLFAGPSVENPVETAGAGIVVGPEDIAGLSAAIARLVEMPATERLRLGERGRQLVEQHYGFDRLAARLVSELDGVRRP